MTFRNSYYRKIDIDEIDIDKIFPYYSFFQIKENSFFAFLKRYFYTRFFTKYKYNYVKKNGNNMLAVYSDFYYRRDHFMVFDTFIKFFDYFNYITPVRLIHDKFDFMRGIEMIIEDFKIWNSFRKNLIFKKNWKRILINFGLAVRYRNQIYKIIKSTEYRYLMVYSDSCIYENLLVQDMKKNGVHTATLQHGKFDINGPYKGIEYLLSVADDFLAWNEWTKDLALQAGLNNVIPLGIPRYIVHQSVRKKQTGLFCVVLGSSQSHNENCELLMFADALSKKINKRYYLRMHPSNKNKEYLDIDKKNLIKNETNESILQMCERADFCLTGSGTSMVVDMIYLKQPFFEYNVEKQPYRDNTFSTFDELLKLALDYDGLICEKTFHYYCTTYDVKNSYDVYFSKYKD